MKRIVAASAVLALPATLALADDPSGGRPPPAAIAAAQTSPSKPSARLSRGDLRPAASTASGSKFDLAQALSWLPWPSQQSYALVTKAPASSDRFWFSAEERLLSFSKSSWPTMLVTGSPGSVETVIAEKVPSSPGFIGLYQIFNTIPTLTATTYNQVLFGGDQSTGLHSGQALRGGYWLDPAHDSGVEAEVFYSGPKGSTSQFVTPPAGAGAPTVSLIPPFFNGFNIGQAPTTTFNHAFINTTPDVFVGLFDEAFTNSAQGAASFSTWSSLFTADADYRTRLWWSGRNRIDVTAGVRYAYFGDAASISTNSFQVNQDVVTYQASLGLPTGSVAVINNTATGIATNDLFQTYNHFVGPELGVGGEYHLGPWSVSGDGKLAFGLVEQSLNVSGTMQSTTTTSVTTPVQTVVLAGVPIIVASPGATNVNTTTSSSLPIGLYARPGVAGLHTRQVFAMAPNGVIRLGYDFIPDKLTATVGYSFFMMTAVARAADQVNGLGAISESTFWAQGVNAGMTYKF